MIEKTTAVPEQQCMVCEEKLDRASDFKYGQQPKPGDYTICLHCGNPMVFNDDMSLRQATKEDIKTLKESSPYAWKTFLEYMRAVDGVHKDKVEKIYRS